jgi:hypothetical protein
MEDGQIFHAFFLSNRTDNTSRHPNNAGNIGLIT